MRFGLLLIDASCFSTFSVKVASLFLLFVSEKKPLVSSINRIFLNQCKFLTKALSSLQNSLLNYQYFVTAQKITIYDNIVCFC